MPNAFNIPALGGRVVASSPEYRAFTSAKYRCNNPADNSYKNYGGRGIRFLFTNFAEFVAEVGPKPHSSLSLERIDVSGHYAPGNVTWATRKTQNNNTRRNVNITAFGKTHTAEEWAVITGVRSFNIIRRHRSGWCGPCSLSREKFRPCAHGRDPNVNRRRKARGRSNARYITVLGETRVQSEWAERFNVPASRIHARRKRGWCGECSVSLPAHESCPHRQ